MNSKSITQSQDNIETVFATANSESTKIEQSRAVAEVQAAAVLAKSNPRDITKALMDLGRVCSRKPLAEKAFYSYPRGGQTVTGVSIQLATEIARVFGNIDYGTKELNVSDNRTEIMTYAWDIESNVRATRNIIVEHTRYSRKGKTNLEDPRDIYENNANNGARRMRACILQVIPTWFIDEAVMLCKNTLQQQDNEMPHEEKVKVLLNVFEKHNITKQELETLIGRKSDKWTSVDMGDLKIHHQSLKQGTITKQELLNQDKDHDAKQKAKDVIDAVSEEVSDFPGDDNYVPQ